MKGNRGAGNWARRRLAAGRLGVACGLALASGCFVQAQDRQELDASASDGLVYVLPGPENVRHTDLWRARLSDGTVRPFMQTPERKERWPLWSTAASALVVEVSAVDPQERSQRLVLWSDGVERDLAPTFAETEAWAAWAAKSSRLAYVFTGLREPEAFNGIAVIDVETGEQTVLAEGTYKRPYIRPELDPEGRRVVAQRLTPRTRPGRERRSEVWLLQPEASPQVLSEQDTDAAKARFTRDGRHVLFTRQEEPDGPGDIVLMRSDGTSARVLASTPESDDHTARASPARDEVAFVSDRDGKNDLFIVDLDGGQPRNLTQHFDFEIYAPRWSPDGERIVVTAMPYEPERENQGARKLKIDRASVLVVDRSGQLLFKTPGFSPDWMPPPR